MEMEIQQFNEYNHGAFKAFSSAREVGLLAYTWANEHYIILNHTEVHPECEGKGIARKLIVQSVEFARQKNLKILPRCPYAKKILERNADVKDVLYQL